MDKIITAIYILFENIDHIVIPQKWFIRKEIEYVTDINQSNSKRKEAKSVYLELSKEVLQHADTFDRDIYEPLAKRLQRQDITMISLIYSQKDRLDIDVPWEDNVNDPRSNSLQVVSRNEEGNIVIQIGLMRN